MNRLSFKRTILPGTVSSFGFSSPPPGWLICDGSVLQRADYMSLFLIIGTIFNTGGETVDEFRLPDLRGEFLRGMDPVGSVDFDRSFGTLQQSSFGEHVHPSGTITFNNVNAPHTHGSIALPATPVTGPHSHTFPNRSIAPATTPISRASGPATGSANTMSSVPSPALPSTSPNSSNAGTTPHTHTLTAASISATHSHNTSEISGTLGAAGGSSDPVGNWPNSAVGANETRPRNVALCLAIKY